MALLEEKFCFSDNGMDVDTSVVDNFGQILEGLVPGNPRGAASLQVDE